MQKSKIYRDMSPEQRLEVLGYAHNQGAGGAAKWLRTGQSQKDGFGTEATKYSVTINKELAALKQSQALEATQLAQAESVKTTTTPQPATPEATTTGGSTFGGIIGSGKATAATVPSTPKSKEVELKAPTPTGPEFPKSKSVEVPTPPSRPPEITPQAGAPDETSTKNFLRSQGIPGASDGGTFKVDGQPISFYPMDKRDDLAAVNPMTQQPLFTARTGETVNVMPEQKSKLNNNPSDTGMTNITNQLASIRSELNDVVGRADRRHPERMENSRNEIPSDNSLVRKIAQQNSQLFQTPSMHRAMSRTRGVETGDGLDGKHFSSTSIA
jgi:hypothetical protein